LLPHNQHIDDGVPTTNEKKEGPTSPIRFIASFEVQALAYIVEESLKHAPMSKDQILLGFVHLIT